MEVGNIVSLYLAIYWESVTDILYSHIKIICHWTMGWTILAPCRDLSSPLHNSTQNFQYLKVTLVRIFVCISNFKLLPKLI